MSLDSLKHTMATNTVSDNFLCSENANELKEESINSAISSFEISLSFKQFPSKSPLLPTVLAQIGFKYDPEKKKLNCTKCSFTLSISTIKDTTQLCNSHAKTSLQCSNLAKQVDFLENEDTVHSNKKFLLKLKRLATYRGIKMDYDPNELARNGFFIQKDTYKTYPGVFKLQCAFCSYYCTIFSQRLYNDNYEHPLKDHVKQNPQCPLVRRNNRTMNKSSSEATYLAKHTLFNYFNKEELKSILFKNFQSPNCDKPFHSGYSTEEARCESFKGWPTNTNQTPVELSKAGFYYYGIKDAVKCFYCNGCLKNWDPTDEPLVEHARWFPKCPYIRQMNGLKFIEEVRKRYQGTSSGFGADYDDLPEYYLNSFGEKRVERNLDDESVNALLNRSSARQLVNQGICRKATLRHVIEKKLECGEIYIMDPVELTKACYEFEDKVVSLQKKLRYVVHICLLNLGDDATDDIVRQFIQQQFKVSLKLIKRFDERNEDTRGLVMMQLYDEDLQRCPEIVAFLNNKTFPASQLPNRLIAKTLVDDNFINERDEEIRRNIEVQFYDNFIDTDGNEYENPQQPLRFFMEDLERLEKNFASRFLGSHQGYMN